MNEDKLKIRKSTGEHVDFDVQKLAHSLRRCKAEDDVILDVIERITPKLYDGISTNEVHNLAFKLLRQNNRCSAARYSLKKAIMMLGPSGFPFENYVSELLKVNDFTTEVGQIVEGHCIKHEVDIVAIRNNTKYFIECKFHNESSKQSNVQVSLYIHSRVNDIIHKQRDIHSLDNYNFVGGIVTNTKFTADATTYGVCSNLHLVSWNYPNGSSLRELIEKDRFYPITILTSLNKQQKQTLIDNKIITCKQLFSNLENLKILNLNKSKNTQVQLELRELSD